MSIKATERELRSLKRKSQKQMANEQHPESADVIIEMQAWMDRLEKRIVKLEQENRYRGSQMDKLTAKRILEER